MTGQFFVYHKLRIQHAMMDLAMGVWFPYFDSWPYITPGSNKYSLKGHAISDLQGNTVNIGARLLSSNRPQIPPSQ